jgi:hypothetical protein
MQFKHLTANPDLPNTAFLEVYPESDEDSYHVLVTPEFLADLEDLKQYRIRMGENVTGDSYLISRKVGPRTKRTQEGREKLADPKQLKMATKGIRDRMFKLSKRCGLDLERLQPSHGIRKAGNTAARNARVDKDFKEVLMGHVSGLDSTYYDISTSESKRELSVEYSKALDSLTLNDTARVKLLQKQLEGQPTAEELMRLVAGMQAQIDSMLNPQNRPSHITRAETPYEMVNVAAIQSPPLSESMKKQREIVAKAQAFVSQKRPR